MVGANPLVQFVLGSMVGVNPLVQFALCSMVGVNPLVQFALCNMVGVNPLVQFALCYFPYHSVIVFTIWPELARGSKMFPLYCVGFPENMAILIVSSCSMVGVNPLVQFALCRMIGANSLVQFALCIMVGLDPLVQFALCYFPYPSVIVFTIWPELLSNNCNPAPASEPLDTRRSGSKLRSNVGVRSGKSFPSGLKPELLNNNCNPAPDSEPLDTRRSGSKLRRNVGVRSGKSSPSGLKSCSFSSNVDDSSSSMAEPISSISSNERYGRVIHDWQKGELLGRGTFGSVYKGIADGGFFFAAKEVSLLDEGENGKQCIIQLEQEIALLRQFKHKNIVQYYGTEKNGEHLYIFLELVSQGSLLGLYQKFELQDPQVSLYTKQILHGLKYLHDRHVIHRDIKCANILVNTNGSVKLADFGLAKVAKLNDVKSCKGSAFWMAPEVFRSKPYWLPADIWSLGCTVLEMLTGRIPYSDYEPAAAIFRIGRGQRPKIPTTISSDARNFIRQCLQVDSSLRPTAAQLLDHPFVKRPLSSSAHSFG